VASPRGAMWHFSTGLNGALKIMLVGDTWKPMVLPRGMLMSIVIMLMSSFHVSC
jgi:ubiquitin-protein ligase